MSSRIHSGASVQTHEERPGSAGRPRWPARAAFPGRRITAAFQHHRYTRTRDQKLEATRALAKLKNLVVV